MIFACDGTSVNQKTLSSAGKYRLHIIYKTVNICSDNTTQEVFFFSDMSHLVITTRNCFTKKNTTTTQFGTRTLRIKCITLIVLSYNNSHGYNIFHNILAVWALERLHTNLFLFIFLRKKEP